MGASLVCDSCFATLNTILLAPLNWMCVSTKPNDLRMQLSPRPDAPKRSWLLPIEHETLKRLKREPEAQTGQWFYKSSLKPRRRKWFPSLILRRFKVSYDDLTLLSEIADRVPFVFGENDLPKTGLFAPGSLAAPFQETPH